MEKALTISMIIIIILSTIITGNPVVKNDELINGLAAVVGIMFCIYIIVKQKKILITKDSLRKMLNLQLLKKIKVGFYGIPILRMLQYVNI